VGQLATLLESSDEVTSALVQLLRGFFHGLGVDVEPVREVELDDNAVDIIVQIDKITTHLASLAAQYLRDGLVGNGSNGSSNPLNALRRILPVLVNCSHNLNTVLGARNRQSLSSNSVDGSLQKKSVYVSHTVRTCQLAFNTPKLL
jgi:hypothetical protein